MEIIVYGKSGCTNCDLAKSALEEMNVCYTYIDIDNYTQVNNIITQIKKEKMKLPYITRDNVAIGGYAQLCTFLKNYEINLNLKLDNF
jgi:glutaredoxin